MAGNGVRTTDFSSVPALDSVLGNRDGATALLPIERLVGIVSSRIGPTYGTLAELEADLAWPAQSLAGVFSDGLNTGTYVKSGVSGAGSWSRIGELPVSSVTDALLGVERQAREAADNELRDELGAMAMGLQAAGDWDPSSGAFPANAASGTYYLVSAAGSVDGASFATGDWLIPLQADAATDTYLGNWATGRYSQALERADGRWFASRQALIGATDVSAGQAVKTPEGSWLLVAPDTYSANEQLEATLITGTVGRDNAILYTAATRGSAGNSITVALVDPGTTNASLAINVSGDDISVDLATDGAGNISSTASEVIAALSADAVVPSLVDVSSVVGSDGSRPVNATGGAQSLTGGGANPAPTVLDLTGITGGLQAVLGPMEALADVDALEEDTRPPAYFEVGQYLRTSKERFSYQKAPSGTSDPHVASRGGVKWFPVPIMVGATGGILNCEQFFWKSGLAVDNGPKVEPLIKAAMANGRTIHFPGEYLTSVTLREDTNGGGLRLTGNGRFKSGLKGAASLGGVPVVWLGNSTGHGEYRGRIQGLYFDGNDAADGNIGLRLHEAGYTYVDDVRFKNSEIAVHGPGAIGVDIERYTVEGTCNNGFIFPKVPSGTPVDNDDVTATGNVLTMRPNASGCRHGYFRGTKGKVVWFEGGQTYCRNSVFQNCGTAGVDLVTFNAANESFDYGGGPSFEDNWMEEGQYRAALKITGTRQAKVMKNFFSFPGADVEQGVVFDNGDNGVAKYNSFRGTLGASPTEGRAANACVYVTESSRVHTMDVEDNYVTTNTLSHYYEGLPVPTVAIMWKPEWAVISGLGSGGTPTIDAASSNWLASVLRNGLGDYTLTFDYAFESNSPSDPPINVQCQTDSSAYAFYGSPYGGNGSSQRIITNTRNGVADPSTMTVWIYGRWFGT